MKDNQCIHFLQWALPELNLRWPGFRRVRRQVCRRIDKRLQKLQLDDIASYRKYLATHPDEWIHLDRMCRITISRFYRDRAVFDYFSTDLLPKLLQNVTGRNNSTLRIWSCGCASGEEPYTAAIIWHYMYRKAYPDIRLEIIATDIDPVLLERAHKACYHKSTLRFLPDELRTRAFVEKDNIFGLRDNLKEYVRFKLSDIRKESPQGTFQVVFCRNLAFTYFDLQLQEKILAAMADAVETGGVLIIGGHEHFEVKSSEFSTRVKNLPVYWKNAPRKDRDFLFDP